MCVSTLEQQGNKETAGRAQSRERGMPGVKEGWKSKCKPGNERKGLQRIREREAGRMRKGWKNYLHPCKDFQGVSQLGRERNSEMMR